MNPEIASAVKPVKSPRLLSLDAYRGFIMLAMASASFGIPETVKGLKERRFWPWNADSAGPPGVVRTVADWIVYQFDHTAWGGCSFWDLIQPSFMFMVGVAMMYSCASRQAQGQSYGRMVGHALYRSLMLVLLGVFLSTSWGSAKQTNFAFVNVLSQIGLGYTFLFLLWNKSPRVQALAAVLILVGYWALFAAYPTPSAKSDFASVNAKGEAEQLTGFAGHWSKNTNVAAAADRWFLNQFPHPIVADKKPESTSLRMARSKKAKHLPRHRCRASSPRTLQCRPACTATSFSSTKGAMPR